MLRRHPHTPAHLALDDAPYFITGAIYGKQPLLQSDALKGMLLKEMRQCAEHFGWTLDHWVILDNHYHAILKSRRGADLPVLMRRLHGRTSPVIRKATACPPPIWWNYWDYCPRDECDYLVRLNYLLYNPVKHGCVADLKDYPHSSFHDLLGRLGREGLAERFRAHPEFRTLDVADDF
jgi:putative transposase